MHQLPIGSCLESTPVGCALSPPPRLFLSLSDQVDEATPRLLVNRERVGQGHPLLRMLGCEPGGFCFEEGNYRCRGGCDARARSRLPPSQSIDPAQPVLVQLMPRAPPTALLLLLLAIPHSAKYDPLHRRAAAGTLCLRATATKACASCAGGWARPFSARAPCPLRWRAAGLGAAGWRRRRVRGGVLVTGLRCATERTCSAALPVGQGLRCLSELSHFAISGCTSRSWAVGWRQHRLGLPAAAACLLSRERPS